MLVLVNPDHVRRGELRCDAVDRHLKPATGKKRQVVELMRMANLDVACTLEVHHAGVKVGHTADLDAWGAHTTVTSIPGATGQTMLFGKPG